MQTKQTITPARVKTEFPLKDCLRIDLKTEPDEQFKLIAGKLLNETAVITLKRKYRLCEIEFYYYNQINTEITDSFYERMPASGVPYYQEDYYKSSINGISHQDVFTHKLGNQAKNGFWYLHTQGSRLKQGNRKGIDLTIGCEDEYTYGGILIRAIQNIDDDKDYIHGPSKVVDRIIEDIGKKSVDEIDEITASSALDKGNKLFIEQYNLDKQDIFSCHRVSKFRQKL